MRKWIVLWMLWCGVGAACSSSPPTLSEDDPSLEAGFGGGNQGGVPGSSGLDAGSPGPTGGNVSGGDTSGASDAPTPTSGDDAGSPDASNGSDGGPLPDPGDAQTGGDVSPSTDSSGPGNPNVWNIDISGVECLYVPESGAFAPVIECYWDSPKQKTAYDDVVMTPVVANLTDDNLDGVVDLKDTPDVAFVTYRREEDGCCKENAVLRVVSGSCQSGFTQQGGAATLLHEHFFVNSPMLDNSGGLAIADINGDQWPEIVGTRVPSGTVAFTGVRYASRPPTALANSTSGWTTDGAPDPLWAVMEADGDDSTMSSHTPGTTARFKWEWGDTSAALAGLHVVATVRSPTGFAELKGQIALGEDVIEASAKTIADGEEFQRVVFSFPRNPFDDDRQWTDSDIDSVEIGIVHTGPAGSELTLTAIEAEVAHVQVLWESAYPSTSDIVTGAQPSITDLDGDGIAEIIIGRVVLDGATGDLVWNGGANGGTGTNAFLGPISFAADLDVDGDLEVIAGNTVYDHEGNTVWTYTYPDNGTGCNEQNLPCDGFNATGNFDTDPEGEIVTVRSGDVYVFEHDGTLKVRIEIPKDDCNYNEGGPPTVADFDGDGEPEIGVAGADFYVVFDLECCASFPDCAGYPADNSACLMPGVRWAVPNKDCSSRVTGSSVFDFDGDGAAEVVYNDETKFRIFRGDDGEILFEQDNTSHTRLEYPIIVDSDRDGNAEIVFIENGADSTAIQIWGDASDNWVPTRQIWNQHAYYINHINEDGSLPPPGGEPNWLSTNNFRQNLPDFDPFLAPDLQVAMLPANPTLCPESLILEAKVCNGGQLWASNLSVRFFDESSQAELECDGGVSMKNFLDAGECMLATCVWNADPAASGAPIRVCVDNFEFACAGPGWNNECNEANNVNTAPVADCP